MPYEESDFDDLEQITRLAPKRNHKNRKNKVSDSIEETVNKKTTSDQYENIFKDNYVNKVISNLDNIIKESPYRKSFDEKKGKIRLNSKANESVNLSSVYSVLSTYFKSFNRTVDTIKREINMPKIFKLWKKNNSINQLINDGISDLRNIVRNINVAERYLSQNSEYLEKKDKEYSSKQSKILSYALKAKDYLEEGTIVKESIEKALSKMDKSDELYHIYSQKLENLNLRFVRVAYYVKSVRDENFYIKESKSNILNMLKSTENHINHLETMKIKINYNSNYLKDSKMIIGQNNGMDYLRKFLGSLNIIEFNLNDQISVNANKQKNLGNLLKASNNDYSKMKTKQIFADFEKNLNDIMNDFYNGVDSDDDPK